MLNASFLNIPEGGCIRIKNAAMRINQTIFLVGSRANNTANAFSDFDYVIPNIKSKKWKKIKNSLPGAKSLADGVHNRIELFKGDLDLNFPYFEVTSNPDIDECRN